MDILNANLSHGRAELLARLAAERSHLLQQLEGVGELALTRDPVFGAWTVSGLLAHLAHTEALTASQLARIAHGLPDDAIPQDSGHLAEAHHGAMPERFARLSFSEGIALCLKERRGVTLALSQVDDDGLERRVRLRSGQYTTPGRLARRLYRHDAGHSAELAGWRAMCPPNDPAIRVIHRALLRPVLSLARYEFLAVAALVPAAEREIRPVEGNWTLKQIIGHLSDYERLGVFALRAVAGGREPDYGETIEDYQRYNSERGRAWSTVSWPEAWAHYVASRRALLEVAATLDDEALARPFISPWLTTTTACGYLLDMAGHEQEHVDALRPALGLPALPRRLNRSGA